jgi:hypothetical protein
MNETKETRSKIGQISTLRRLASDKLGKGIWGLTERDDKFTHEEIAFLFARIFPALGIDQIITIRSKFPDCICITDDGIEIGIELEPSLSSFGDHINKHDLTKCHCIVCWNDDLELHSTTQKAIKEHQIEVIELQTLYKDIKVTKKSHKTGITQKDIDKLTYKQLRALKAFIRIGKDILTKEEILRELGISGKGLGGSLKGFPELAKRKHDWLVRQRPDKKWQFNTKHKDKVIKKIKEFDI